MMWSDNTEEEKKYNIIKVLSILLKSDGKHTPIEQAYIAALGKSFGIDKDELENILKEETSEVLIPSSEEDRMTILFYLLLLMKIDKHVSREEEKLIFHFGFKLGFRDNLIRDLVNTIKRYSDRKLPPNILMQKVKKYLN